MRDYNQNIERANPAHGAVNSTGTGENNVVSGREVTSAWD